MDINLKRRGLINRTPVMIERSQGQSKSGFTRYIGELAQLRLAIEQNIQDFETVEQIIYLVDSNVVRLFLSPYQRWRSVSPFKDILDRGNSELGIATAVITVEYIFSKMLAQQRGYPAFVAPEHVDEIIEYFRSIDSKSSNRNGDISKPKPSDSQQTSGGEGLGASSPSVPLLGLPEERLRNSVEYMSEQLSKHSYNADELRRLLGKTIPQMISQLDGRDLFPRQHFARLQRNDLIRPLHLAPHIDRRWLEEYPQEELEEWRSTLEIFFQPDVAQPEDLEPRPGSENLRDDVARRDQIINRDAAVLTKLFALNENLRKRSVPAKIVFLTDDQKIHNAVAYRRVHERFSGENFLRRPLQFLPMLNFQEMPNIVFKSSLTLELRSVIDSILGLRAEISSDFLNNVIHRFALEIRQEQIRQEQIGQELKIKADPSRSALLQAWHNTVERSFSIRNTPHIEDGRNKVRAAWDNLAKAAVSLNVELSARRFGEDLGALAHILAELKKTDSIGDLANAFELYQEQQIDVLERQHVEWCLEWLTADPVHREANYIPRGPLLVRQERLGLTDDANFRQAVDEIARGPAGHAETLTSRLRETIKHYGILQLEIVAALLAYRNGAWAQARDLGERALDRLRKLLRDESSTSENRVRDNIRELQYLVALCRRFELSEIISAQYPAKRNADVLRPRFDFANRILRNALEDAGERFDCYDEARANAELGTLYLTGIAISTIHPELGLLGYSEIHRFSLQAIEYLRRAKRDLETHFSELSTKAATAENMDLANDLYFKINMNLISAFTFFSFEELYIGKLPTSWVETALKIVRPQLKNFPQHLAIECDVCEWILLEEGRGKGLRAIEIAANCDMILSSHQSMLTRLDRKELERYRNRLSVSGHLATRR
jgi:hypothetical protein